MNIIFKIILLLLAIPVGWLILAETVGWLVRKLHPFPMPAFAAQVLDLPLRWGYLTTALLFTAIHLPARLLGGEPLAQALTYVGVQILPMALLFGGAMVAAGHTVAPALVHLAWNWASVIRHA